MTTVSLVLLALVAGSLVFCALTVEAARRYLRLREPIGSGGAAVSVLKPLAGADEGLEANLRSFFDQDYGEFEILFAVRTESDPAVTVVEKLRREYPNVPARLIVTGEPPYPNAKVFSLDRMMQEARYNLLVMSDSDIRVGRDMLSIVAAEFEDPHVAVMTCPYRAVPGTSLWSRLEAIMMNTEFLSGIMVARMLEGMRFAVGPTIVARRDAIRRIGGCDYLKDFLAEDFVMGQRAAEMGMGVGLSRYVIEHRIGSEPFLSNARHRLRWNRSTRRSRPLGYVGQLFTYPVPLALLLTAAWPAAWPTAWPMLTVTVAMRGAAAWMIAWRVLRDPLTASRWWLVPVQDVLSFLFWIAGFFGNTIDWRGREYVLRADGRFERKA
jgi:ceramide glucosyltransferase